MQLHFSKMFVDHLSIIITKQIHKFLFILLMKILFLDYYNDEENTGEHSEITERPKPPRRISGFQTGFAQFKIQQVHIK